MECENCLDNRTCKLVRRNRNWVPISYALLQSLSYWIVQIPALFYVDNPEQGKDLVKWFALGGRQCGSKCKLFQSFILGIGSVVCLIFLALYCTYQVINPKMQKRKIEQARKDAILRSTLQKFVARMKHVQEEGM